MLDMVDISGRDDGNRLVVEIDPKEPVALAELSESFAALDRLYARNNGGEAGDARLYVTKLTSGSVIAELAPYAVIMGGLALMDAAVIVADFTKRLNDGFRAFAGLMPPGTPMPAAQDAEDLRALAAPMLGKNGARLGLKSVRIHKSHRDITAEYEFFEPELNRAALNIDRYVAAPSADLVQEMPRYEPFERKLLLVAQASRAPGKQRGRTGDRGTIPDISDDQLPLYFGKSVNDVKAQMVRSSVNPLAEHAFIVSGYVETAAGLPKNYIITELHDIVAAA